jgi:general secretion pathway protein G
MNELRKRCLRRAALRGQRGMTLLEILIVLAILAVVMGFLLGPRLISMLSESQEDAAGILVRKYAHEAYARWQLRNQGQSCPSSLEELGKLIDQETVDPWGTELVMLCGESAPPEANGFGVISAGPDRKMGTEDDINSWERRKRTE